MSCLSPIVDVTPILDDDYYEAGYEEEDILEIWRVESVLINKFVVSVESPTTYFTVGETITFEKQRA